MLDLVGRANTRLIETEEGTVCEMVDSYLPQFKTPFREYRDALELRKPGELIRYGIKGVIQTTSYIRTINVLAHYLGIEERIHLYIPETSQFLIDYRFGLTPDQVEEKYAQLRDGGARMYESQMVFFGEVVPGFISIQDINDYREKLQKEREEAEREAELARTRQVA